MIAIGSDHGGLNVKKSIVNYLKENNIEYKDFGTDTEESVDYPIFAKSVANSVALGECRLGVLCCGTGIGMSIAANKVQGIRAALCNDEFCAQMSRKHNNANIMCIGGRIVSPEKAVLIFEKFISTDFEGGRHQKRIEQVMNLENK